MELPGVGERKYQVKKLKGEKEITIEDIARVCDEQGLECNIKTYPRYPLTAEQAFLKAGYTKCDHGEKSDAFAWRKILASGELSNIAFTKDGQFWNSNIEGAPSTISAETTWGIFLQMNELKSFDEFIDPELLAIFQTIRYHSEKEEGEKE